MKTLALLLVSSIGLMAQLGPTTGPVIQVTVAPSGSCTGNLEYLVSPGGLIYTCQNGTWAQVTGSGGGSPGGSTNDVQLNGGSSNFIGTGGLFGYNPTTGGLYFSATNPTYGGSGNGFTDVHAIDNKCTTNGTSTVYGFPDENCIETTFTINNGQSFGNVAKTTFEGDMLTVNATGAGQRIGRQVTMNCYGISDCAPHQETTLVYGRAIAGDEGETSVFNIIQTPTQLSETTQSGAVTRTSCNTTLAANVTANTRTVQSIQVASSTNCNIGDYVVIGQEAATNNPQESWMKITAVADGTHISGIVIGSYMSGATVTPATVISTSNTNTFGQGRYLVDRSGSSYSTGTYTAIGGVGPAVTGSGTTWTSSMVGGSALVPGCFSPNGDTWSNAPFNGTGVNGPLMAWYPISTVASNTSIKILGGDNQYTGPSAGGGNYNIFPCAKILYIVTNSLIVLETNTFTWSNGDTLEAAIDPSPYVNFHQERSALYQSSLNAAGSSWFDFINEGVRAFNTGLTLDDHMASGGDTFGYYTGIQITHTQIGMNITETQLGEGVVLNATTTTTASQTPCYNIQGGAMWSAPLTGLCGSYSTGALQLRQLDATYILPTAGVTTGTVTLGLPNNGTDSVGNISGAVTFTDSATSPVSLFVATQTAAVTGVTFSGFVDGKTYQFDITESGAGTYGFTCGPCSPAPSWINANTSSSASVTNSFRGTWHNGTSTLEVSNVWSNAGFSLAATGTMMTNAPGSGILIGAINPANSQPVWWNSSTTVSAGAATDLTITPVIGRASAALPAGDVLCRINIDGTQEFCVPFALTTTGTSGATTYSSGTLNVPQYASGSTSLTVANASSTGTTTNTLTKLTGAPSTAVISATTDTGGAIGITTAGAGTTGNATVTLSGSVTCVFDGATTAGHYVQISSTTAGNCHDAGATYNIGAQIVGRVLSTNASSGSYTIDLFPSEIQSPATSSYLSQVSGGMQSICASSLATNTGCGTLIPGSSLVAGDAYYVGSGGLALAEANASSTIPGVCLAVSATACAFSGAYRFSSSQSWTEGNIIYISDATAGALVTTAPSTSGHFVQVIGVALANDTILLMPSLDVAGIQ